MGRFFSADYPGPAFVLLGPAHIAALTAIIFLNLFLIRFRNASKSKKKTLRWILAIALWSAEISWHIWNVAVDRWTIQSMLPFNICSLFIWLSGFMLILKNFHIYEFAYFLGIGGATQYLATPDLGIYGFPHFRFFQTFVSHGLLLTSAVYMTVVEGFRPTWKSLGRVVLFTNLYMVIIYCINRSIGSDYLMLNAKPATPSLLDLLPPWPYYIMFMELIGIVTLLLLYVPFFVKDLRQAPKKPALCN